MNKTIYVEDGPRFISIEVKGEAKQTTILKDGKLITSSLVQKPHVFTHYLEPGEYQISSDGKLGKIKLSDVDDSFRKRNVDLDTIKDQILDKVTALSIAKRKALIPDYRLQNAALGIYDDNEVAIIKATIEEFRKEYYRIEKLVEKAKTKEDLGKIKPNFPTKIKG